MERGKKALIISVICAMLLTIPMCVCAVGQYELVGVTQVGEELEQMFDSALLIDMDGDVVLFEKEPDRVFSPTGGAVHLMSAYVVAAEAEWEQEIPVIDAVNELPSNVRKFGIEPTGERWLVKDLVAVMMLHSAQDAALILSDHVSGSQQEYVALMNQYAASLGMENTQYASPLGGYESGQTTTVSDLALLCQRALQEERLAGIITAGTYDTINGYSVTSRLDAMNESGGQYDARIKGIGEGGTTSSGTNIILYLQDGERSLLFIGFTETYEDRNSESDAIGVLNYFLENTIRVDVTQAVQPLLSASAINAADGAVITPAMAAAQCLITAEKSVGEGIMENQELFRLSSLPELAQAPEENGPIGDAVLLFEDRPVSSVPLIAGSIALPGNRTPAVSEDPPYVESTTLSLEIPVYSAEDWQGAQQEKSAMDQYGFYFITASVILLAVVVLLVAHVIRRKKR